MIEPAAPLYRTSLVTAAADSAASAGNCIGAKRAGISRVLIVAALFTLPYRVMRACAAAGAKVTILGGPGSAGLRWSRCCDRFEPVGSRLDPAAPGEAADTINRALERSGAELVVPGDAPMTRLLCALDGELSAPRFPLPDLATFDLLNDKWAFTNFAEGVGLPCPRTHLFADVTALRQALVQHQIRLPAMAKPLSADGAAGIVKLTGHDAVTQTGQIDYAPILVQDFIDGEDIGATIFAEQGVVRHHIVHRLKRRTYDVLDHPRILTDLATVARALGLTGVFNFDMRLAPDGSIYYLECNPRFFYKMDLSMVAGINFAAAGLPGCGAAVPPSVPSGTRVRMPKALAADLITPRELSGRDWRMLRYYLSDPICYARERLGIDGES
jgi:hypothetical protein